MLNPITDGGPAANDGTRSFVDRAARWATLAGVALCPAIGLGAGFSFGDLFLLLATLLRGVQLLTTGLRLQEFRRHDFLLAITICIGLGGFFAGVPNNSPMPTYLVQTIIATAGGLVVVATYGTTDRGLRELIRAYALGGALLAVLAFYVPFVADRAVSYSTHPNILGHSEMMVVACAIACYDWSRDRYCKMLWAGVAGLGSIAIYLSGSRGSLIGLFVAALLYLVFSGRIKIVLLALGTVWLAVLLILGGIVSVPGDSAIGRLLGDPDTSGANTERAQALEDVLIVIGDKPIIGDGFDSAILVHVVYLLFWSAGGAMAGAAVMYLGVAMLASPFLRPRTHLALRCGLAGLAVMWLFTNIFFARDQWLFIIIAFRLCLRPDRTSLPEALPVDPEPAIVPEYGSPVGSLR